jgi:hypothetical protein
MLPLLAAALLLSEGSAALRWEHAALVEAPLQAAVELSFDDPAPCYGPEVRPLDGRDRVLESRLLLAQRLGALLFSASATLAANLRYGVETDLGYAAGLSLPAGPLGLGVQLSGGIGDPHAFVEPPCGDPQLGAVVSWSFAPGWTTRALGGAALGGPMLVRMHLAYEF